MNRVLTFALAAAALAFGPGAGAQALMKGQPATDTDAQVAKIESVAQLLMMGEKFDKEGDWRRYASVMQRLTQLRPEAGNIKYELAAAYAMQDDKQHAYDLLMQLKELGWSLKPQDDERFKNAQGTKVWDFIVDAFATNGKPQGEGKVAFELPKDLLVEGIAYDPKTKSLIAASTREGKVLRVSADGKTSDLVVADAENGLMSVLDVAVDPAHDALWVASAGGPLLKKGKTEDYGKSGVWHFELSTGKFVDKYMVEGAGRHELTAIALAPNGDVYAADGAARAIYKLRQDKLEIALANPKLTNIRGVAISGDGSKMFLADYEVGVFGIDLAKGNAWQVRAAKKQSMFGIDGLSWRDGELIAVQNGMTPRRIVRMKLDDDGKSVASFDVLASGRPELALPTRGVAADGKFYVIANNQRGMYDRYGIPRDEKKLEPTRIFAIDL